MFNGDQARSYSGIARDYPGRLGVTRAPLHNFALGPSRATILIPPRGLTKCIIVCPVGCRIRANCHLQGAEHCARIATKKLTQIARLATLHAHNAPSPLLLSHSGSTGSAARTASTASTGSNATTGSTASTCNPGSPGNTASYQLYVGAPTIVIVGAHTHKWPAHIHISVAAHLLCILFILGVVCIWCARIAP